MKGGYDILPNIMLVGAEQELSQTGKEHRLKEAIAPVAEKYRHAALFGCVDRKRIYGGR